MVRPKTSDLECQTERHGTANKFKAVVQQAMVFFFSSGSLYLLIEGCRRARLHLITQTHTHHSVGFPWTKDRPVAVTSTCITHNIHNKHPRTRWDSNPRSQEVRLCEVERNYRITLTGSGPPNNTYACIKRI